MRWDADEEEEEEEQPGTDGLSQPAQLSSCRTHSSSGADQRCPLLHSKMPVFRGAPEGHFCILCVCVRVCVRIILFQAPLLCCLIRCCLVPAAKRSSCFDGFKWIYHFIYNGKVKHKCNCTLCYFSIYMQGPIFELCWRNCEKFMPTHIF